MLTVAAIQMVSTDDVKTNLHTVQTLIQQAADAGAKCLLLPENFAFMGQHENDKMAIAEVLGEGPIQTFLQTQAQLHKVTIIAGTIPIRSPHPNRVYASSLVYDSHGERLGVYHKMHLFDVSVSDAESYLESASVMPGTEVVTIATEFATLGLSVCYDVRFPELYRLQSQQGATVLFVPSAFTLQTGQAHWHILLRARAIENLAFVIAANQGGTHVNGRQTYGHSLIVDYWGRILAEQKQAGPGVIIAKLDFAAQHAQRETFPAIIHRVL